MDMSLQHSALSGAGATVLFAAQRFCIHRYPASLIDRLTLADGRSVLVRPVLPQDAALQQQFVRELSPTSRYRRFHGPMRELSADTLDYLTQVDYRSHLALLAETFDPRGEEVQVAEVRYVRREGEAGRLDAGIADFAIAVADEWQGAGLGSRMLDALVRSARDGGVRRLEGSVLADNEPMRALVRARGWRIRRDPDDARLVIAWLDVEPAAALAPAPAIERRAGMALC
ncbi:MAG: GNAT family N-acetyltransferase [Burkholderiaceae bacterium]|nr:GNAT family N-acetyltransferase [Burkholderiaceae bacterium]